MTNQNGEKILDANKSEQFELKITTEPKFLPSRPRKNGTGMTKEVRSFLDTGYSAIPTGLKDSNGWEVKARIELFSVKPKQPVAKKAQTGSVAF
jgi:hypothetical protein